MKIYTIALNLGLSVTVDFAHFIYSFRSEESESFVKINMKKRFSQRQAVERNRKKNIPRQDNLLFSNSYWLIIRRLYHEKLETCVYQTLLTV